MEAPSAVEARNVGFSWLPGLFQACCHKPLRPKRCAHGEYLCTGFDIFCRSVYSRKGYDPRGKGTQYRPVAVWTGACQLRVPPPHACRTPSVPLCTRMAAVQPGFPRLTLWTLQPNFLQIGLLKCSCAASSEHWQPRWIKRLSREPKGSQGAALSLAQGGRVKGGSSGSQSKASECSW